MPLWLCINVKQEMLWSESSISQDVLVTVIVLFSSFLQKCGKTLVLFRQKLLEKTSRFYAMLLSSKTQRSCVRVHVQKKRTFSLRQVMSQLLVADTTLKKALHTGCMSQSHGWPSLTQDCTSVVMAVLCLQFHTHGYRSSL